MPAVLITVTEKRSLFWHRIFRCITMVMVVGTTRFHLKSISLYFLYNIAHSRLFLIPNDYPPLRNNYGDKVRLD